MAQYGEVRVDYITYTTGTVPTEANATVTVSSLVNDPTFSGDVQVGGNVTITGNLNVSGDSLFDGITVSGNSVLNTLTVTGGSNLEDAEISGTLTVTGNTFISGDLTVQGDLNASGVTISGFTGLFASGTEAAPSISFVDDTDTGFYRYGDNDIGITTNGSRRAQIDSSGNVLIATSTSRTIANVTSKLQIEGVNNFNSSSMSVTHNRNDDSSPLIQLCKSRGSVYGSNDLVAEDDRLGRVTFHGTDGTGAIAAARIDTYVDGPTSSGNIPGRLVFATTASGAAGPTAQMALDKDGQLGIGTQSPVEKLTVETGNVLIGQNTGANTGIRNYLKFGRTNFGAKAAIGFINDKNYGRGSILFMNDPAGDDDGFDDADEVMRITSTGFVAISTLR